MNVPPSSATPQLDTERLFAEKKRKFEDADKSFRDLVDSLTEYKAAMLHEAECGVTVATKIHKFFAVQDRPHKQVANKFLEARQSIRSKWVTDAEKNFEADVLAPIKSRLKEIPDVRSYIKNRSNALAEMQRRQKKLQAERRREGARFRDKQRKCREMSEQYSFHNEEVIKRFSYLERNMGNFVTAPLRSLVTIMSEVSQAAVDSLALVLTMISETPPITKDLSRAPAMLNDVTGGVVGAERWDESFEDNNRNSSNNNNNSHNTSNEDTSNRDDDQFDNINNPNATDDDPFEHLPNGPTRLDQDSLVTASPVTNLSQFMHTGMHSINTPGGFRSSSAAGMAVGKSHSRVRSVEAGPGVSAVGMETSPFGDFSHISNPRRELSASSAPGDSSSTLTDRIGLGHSSIESPSKNPTALPAPIQPLVPHGSTATHLHHQNQQQQLLQQHYTTPGSSSGHASHPSVTTTVAVNSVPSSNGSTDNMVVTDRATPSHLVHTHPATGMSYFPNTSVASSASAAAAASVSRMRRQRVHHGSIDTVGSAESSSGNASNVILQHIHPDRPLSMDGLRPTSTTTTTTNITNSNAAHKEFIGRLVAIYQFTPREENELALEVGNVIEVISRNDSGWWCGQCGRYRGYFPQNYTRPLTDKEELEYMAEKERKRKRRGHRRQVSVDSKPSGQGQAPLPTQSSVTAN